MNFTDLTLIRLADESSRAGVFDEAALAQLLAAAYDTERLPLSGPFTPVFDELRLGYVASAPAVLEGGWSTPAGQDRSELRVVVSGAGAGAAAARVDALWRGSIVARAAAGVDRIERVATDWPDSTEGTVSVTFAPGAPPAPAALPLPIVVALVIRDAGFGLAELVADSHALRERLAPLGLERPRDERLPVLHPLVVGWIVPESVFDDAGWPGGDGAADAAERRARRRTAAGRWLAREGIGLINPQPLGAI